MNQHYIRALIATFDHECGRALDEDEAEDLLRGLATALREDEGAVEAIVDTFMRNLSSGAVMNAEHAANQARDAVIRYLESDA